MRANFRLDLFSGICSGIFISVLVAFMPIVVRRAGGSAFEVALVVAAPFIGHLLTPLTTTLLVGRPPARVVATTLLAARLVFIAGVLAATTPFLLAITTVTTYVITLSHIAAYVSLMAVIYPDRERAQAIGKVRIGVSIAGIASASIAGAFIDVVPAGWVFAASALLSLPGAFAFLGMRDERTAPLPPRRPMATIARDVWADRRYRALLTSFLVFGSGNLANAAMIPLLLVDRYDAPPWYVGLFAALQAATAIVAYVALGRVLDRGSTVRVTLYNSLVAMTVPIAYLVAPNVWALLPVALVVGASLAAGELTYYLNIVELAPRERIGEYATANSMLLGLRGTLAPFVASAALAVVPIQGVMLGAICLMGVGVALMTRVVRAPVAVPEPVAASP